MNITTYVNTVFMYNYKAMSVISSSSLTVLIIIRCGLIHMDDGLTRM